MKQIRKLLILLSIVVMILQLNGCDSAKKNNNEEKNKSENIGETGNGIDSGEKVDLTNGEGKEVQDTKDGPGTGVANDKVQIAKKVLFDQDNVKITALSFDEDGFLGPEIKVLIENNTDVNVTVQLRETSVNGFMVEPSFSSDVAAGMKANDSIIFLTEEMTANKIEKLAVIEFRFDIFNSNTWDTIVESDIIVIETNVKESYIQEYDASGNVVFEGKGFKIVEKGLDISNKMMGPQIRFYIENNSDKMVTVQTRDVSVNGYMVEASFSRDITPGKKANDGLLFLNLEKNDITDIKKAELRFDIFDTETWETIVETDVVKLTFK